MAETDANGGALAGQRGELRATITITRAATGKVEYYDLVGFADPADLDAFLAAQPGTLPVSEATATLTSTVDAAALVDASAVVDQAAVTSHVTVDGLVTVRTYSDGSQQRNVWDSADRAQEYANEVNGVS